MFRIDSNNNLMLNSGDDTGDFPLVINVGDTLNQQELLFSRSTINVINNNSFDVTIDKVKWQELIVDSGVYVFHRINGEWRLNNNIVDIQDYGISVNGKVTDGQYFSIDFVAGVFGQVTFYLMQPMSNYKQAIFKKTFNSEDNLYSEGDNAGRIQLSINHNDLLTDECNKFQNIPEGKYCYYIKAKLLNEEKQYEYITLMNKHYFYIIEDDYTNRAWTQNSNSVNACIKI